MCAYGTFSWLRIAVKGDVTVGDVIPWQEILGGIKKQSE